MIPFRELARLRELVEETEELRAFDAATVAASKTVPREVITRVVAGESPLRVWRERCGLTQPALAEGAGCKPGSIAVLKRLATALGVEVDDLLPD